MSRGPGAIERAIEAAFLSSPSSIFLTADLVRVAYPGVSRIEKKHRVAVLRAADKVAARVHWQGLRCSRPSGSIVYYNLCDVRSYAVGRLRQDFIFWRDYPNVEDLFVLIDDPGNRHGYWSLVQPGGAWHKHVEINCLARDGRVDEAEVMHKAWNEPLRREMNAIKVALTR